VLDDYRMVILGSFGGSFWTIISKVPPIPLVFGKMGFKKVLKMTQKWSFWGHLEGPFGPLFQKFPRFRWCLVKWGSERVLKNGHLGPFGVV
jgi:hypothetical protein